MSCLDDLAHGDVFQWAAADWYKVFMTSHDLPGYVMRKIQDFDTGVSGFIYLDTPIDQPRLKHSFFTGGGDRPVIKVSD